jgi:hypothetical protein
MWLITRRSASRVAGSSMTELNGSTVTPCSVAASQPDESASPARSQSAGSSPGPYSIA